MNQEIGRAIRARRVELGLTQSQFAAKLGCTITTVSRWENGNRTPGLWFRHLLTALFALNLPADMRIKMP